MRQGRQFAFTAVVGAALVAVLALATPASARKFKIGGSNTNWIIRNGQVFIPLQFAATAMGTGGGMTHISMGNLTGAFFFPNGPMPGAGAVTANGSAPASIMIPKHRFVEDVMAAVPLGGITLVQITTNFGIDAPYQTATLAKNAGPGSFTWCPGAPGCVKLGGMLGTDPPAGMGATRNGRVIYKKGANRFGGTMQMGLKRGGINSFVFDTAPFQVGHVFFGGTGTRNLAPGAGPADNPATEMVYLKAGIITQPITFMAGGLVVNPGPKVTTMLGLTNTMTMGVPLQLVLGTGTPNDPNFKFGQFTSNFGFQHTTGTVWGQQTAGTGGDDFLTFMGYDKRTALGAGAIQTVAGGLSYRNTNAGQTPYASLHRTRMQLSSPVPSMSPAGFAAAGALMLVVVGYALRRRLH